MKDVEFKDALVSRRSELEMTFKNIQELTGLGYNTVRRVFREPFKCRLKSVVAVVQSMGCELVFSIENRIGDELDASNSKEKR